MLIAILVTIAGAALAGGVYVMRERMGWEGLGLAGLRTIAFGALLFAFFNPVTSSRFGRSDPTVLLDASLSMRAAGGRWTQALDTARALARDGGVILRFGSNVVPFDSTSPTEGRSRVADALRIAAGRPGPAIVVTDGEIEDRSGIPPSLLNGVGVVWTGRDTLPDVALLDVAVGERYLEGDSITAAVTVGSWDLPAGGADATIDVLRGEQRIATQQVTLSAGASVVRRHVTIGPDAVPVGTQALRFRITTPGDQESGDDERVRVVTVSSQPGVVVIVDPADPEGRFLVRELTSVVRSGVRGFARIQRDQWVEMQSLAPVSESAVRSAAREAALVVLHGAGPGVVSATSRWYWPAVGGSSSAGTEFFEGDWYVTGEIGPSPLAGRLAAVLWDSVPPLTGIIPVVAGPDQWVAFSGRLGRRGGDRPLLVGRDSAGIRILTTTTAGMWRWALRGGAALEAYRAVLAAGTDWLLADDRALAGPGVRVSPVAARGDPLVVRRLGTDVPDTLAVRFSSADTTIDRDAVFDTNGDSRLLLPPGEYRWSVPTMAGAAGVSVVESYSDEFHPRPVTVQAALASAGFDVAFAYAREHWWLFVVAMTALLGEWAWRQRRGLP